MILRRLTAMAAITVLFAACGSDSANPEADDTATGQDAVTDTSSADDTSSAPDTVTPPHDTQVAEDTAPLQDTQGAEDTTPPQDTTPVDLGEGTCPGMRACVAGCASAADVDQCESDCLAAADNADETQAYDDLVACLADNSCDDNIADDEDQRDLYACYRHCLPEIAACDAGSYGEDSCVDVSGCIAANCMDESDFRCRRSCMETASAEAIRLYLDWDYCSLAECYDTNDVIAMENCIQQVRNTFTCSDVYTDCFGSTGASPGAGAGGGK